MKITELTGFWVSIIIYSYFFILRPVIAKRNVKNLGDKVLYLGYSSRDLVWFSILSLLAIPLELYQDNLSRYFHINLIVIIYYLLFIAWSLYIGLSKSYIHENGISSSISSWSWDQIKHIEWYKGMNNRIKGFKIFTEKNMLTSITGFQAFEVNKKQLETVKEYIELHYKDKIK